MKSSHDRHKQFVWYRTITPSTVWHWRRRGRDRRPGRRLKELMMTTG
jgi:hypothetical protein